MVLNSLENDKFIRRSLATLLVNTSIFLTAFQKLSYVVLSRSNI